MSPCLRWSRYNLRTALRIFIHLFLSSLIFEEKFLTERKIKKITRKVGKFRRIFYYFNFARLTFCVFSK